VGLDNPLHIAFLVVILLLVFGAKKLPEIGRSLGEGMRGFKSGITGTDEEHKATLTPAEAQPPAAVTSPPPPVATPSAPPPPVSTEPTLR
jgi:sec-independent protein translocase protein TatA